jgi:corrinoid protein of di/trimethylamine methyltransferase
MALRSGLDPLRAFRQGLAVAMNIVGERMAKSEMFVTEVMLSANAMKSAMEILRPHMGGTSDRETQIGNIVIGSAQGDIHDIGKNIVATMLGASGFSIYDLGIDTPASRFISEAERARADIIATSALLSTTMTSQRELIEQLKSKDIRSKYRVLVGGGIVTQDWADSIGADGYGEDAVQAIAVAKKLLST